MKTKLTLFVAVIGVALFGTGCASSASLNNSQSLIKTGDVIGVYQFTTDQKNFQFSFYANGTVERFYDGNQTTPAAWKIEGNEIRLDYSDGVTHYLIRDAKGNLLLIAGNGAGEKKRNFNNGWTAKKVK